MAHPHISSSVTAKHCAAAAKINNKGQVLRSAASEFEILSVVTVFTPTGFLSCERGGTPSSLTGYYC